MQISPSSAAEGCKNNEHQTNPTMNFKELNNKLGGCELESNWRQASGGGWIHKSAKVDHDCNVAEDSIVWGRVSGDAQVSARRAGIAAVGWCAK